MLEGINYHYAKFQVDIQVNKIAIKLFNFKRIHDETVRTYRQDK